MVENEWTDELKQQVVEAYEALEPTPETTMDAVKTVANDFGKTPNGVRMVLSRAGVYIRKEAPKAASSSKSGSTRVNKAEAIAGLKAAIKAAGKDVDDDICDRLTGKAAVYLTGLLS
jgi:hypothetical protein